MLNARFMKSHALLLASSCLVFGAFSTHAQVTGADVPVHKDQLSCARIANCSVPLHHGDWLPIYWICMGDSFSARNTYCGRFIGGNNEAFFECRQNLDLSSIPLPAAKQCEEVQDNFCTREKENNPTREEIDAYFPNDCNEALLQHDDLNTVSSEDLIGPRYNDLESPIKSAYSNGCKAEGDRMQDDLERARSDFIQTCNASVKPVDEPTSPELADLGIGDFLPLPDPPSSPSIPECSVQSINKCLEVSCDDRNSGNTSSEGLSIPSRCQDGINEALSIRRGESSVSCKASGSQSNFEAYVEEAGNFAALQHIMQCPFTGTDQTAERREECEQNFDVADKEVTLFGESTNCTEIEASRHELYKELHNIAERLEENPRLERARLQGELQELIRQLEAAEDQDMSLSGLEILGYGSLAASAVGILGCATVGPLCIVAIAGFGLSGASVIGNEMAENTSVFEAVQRIRNKNIDFTNDQIDFQAPLDQAIGRANATCQFVRTQCLK